MRNSENSSDYPLNLELLLTDADRSLLRDFLGHLPQESTFPFDEPSDDPFGDQDFQPGGTEPPALPAEVVAELNNLATQPGTRAFIIVRTTTEILVSIGEESQLDSQAASANTTELPANTQVILYEQTVICHYETNMC